MQTEDAIAWVEIKIGAVQFAAMAQAGSEVLLRQFCLPNLCLEIVEGGCVLRMEQARNSQCKRRCPRNRAYHFPLRTRGMHEEFYIVGQVFVTDLPLRGDSERKRERLLWVKNLAFTKRKIRKNCSGFLYGVLNSRNDNSTPPSRRDSANAITHFIRGRWSPTLL